MHILIVLVAALAVAGIGCGNGGDVGGTGGVDGTLDLDIGPGEVRAGRLTASQLPDNENGLAMYEEGDFALVNEHIALIIEDEGVSELYAPFGGLIVATACGGGASGSLGVRDDSNRLEISADPEPVMADEALMDCGAGRITDGYARSHRRSAPRIASSSEKKRTLAGMSF